GADGRRRPHVAGRRTPAERGAHVLVFGRAGRTGHRRRAVRRRLALGPTARHLLSLGGRPSPIQRLPHEQPHLPLLHRHAGVPLLRRPPLRLDRLSRRLSRAHPFGRPHGPRDAGKPGPRRAHGSGLTRRRRPPPLLPPPNPPPP